MTKLTACIQMSFEKNKKKKKEIFRAHDLALFFWRNIFYKKE